MKILDNDFRKGLYKNLVDAGYDKAEAQKIVGVKYFNALKEKVNTTISTISEHLANDNFTFVVDETWLKDFNADLLELQKMQAIVQG
jgi:hypothetical protein